MIRSSLQVQVNGQVEKKVQLLQESTQWDAQVLWNISSSSSQMQMNQKGLFDWVALAQGILISILAEYCAPNLDIFRYVLVKKALRFQKFCTLMSAWKILWFHTTNLSTRCRSNIKTTMWTDAAWVGAHWHTIKDISAGYCCQGVRSMSVLSLPCGAFPRPKRWRPQKLLGSAKGSMSHATATTHQMLHFLASSCLSSYSTVRTRWVQIFLELSPLLGKSSHLFVSF